MKKIPHLLFLIFITSTTLKAQEPQFTQYFNAPLYLNPAFTGLTDLHRFSVNYRNQWPGMKKGYSTYMASYDYNMNSYNSGIGGFVAQDVAGSVGLANTFGAVNYSYKIKTGYDGEIRGGIMAGFGQKRIDNTKLVFNDQFITGAATSADAAAINSKTYLDLGFGALYNSDNFWGGISVKHINSPDVSMNGSAQHMPVFTSLHTGYRIVLSSDSVVTQAVTISAHYRHEKANDQLDIGASYKYKMIFAGLWYRGLPLKKYGSGYSNNESIAILAGTEIPGQKLKICYSYDLTVSSLTYKNTNGAHEVSIIYEMGSSKKKKVVKKKGVSIRQKF